MSLLPRLSFLARLVALLLVAALAAPSSAQGPGLPPVQVKPQPLDPPLPCTCPAWLLSGNSGTQPALHFLGTLDNKALSLRTFNARAMQYAYAANSQYNAINVLGGTSVNTIATGTIGATIAGGGADWFSSSDYPNSVSADFGTIGGGAGNLASNVFATVSGGEENEASGMDATVGGGALNVASGPSSTVGGGFVNVASLDYATVGGGSTNSATGDRSTIGGGTDNLATGTWTTIAGGHLNVAAGYECTVGGGHVNDVGGDYGTIAGGHESSVSGNSGAIGGGEANVVSATHGTIPGGAFNLVQGSFGFAAGQQAEALHQGAFVWADSTNAPFASSAIDQFSVRAAGGARFFSDGAESTGVLLAPNAGAWSTVSARESKEDVEPVDPRDVLERLAAVPISSWRYRGQDGVRHMGPMAQDFYAAFGLGLGEKTIDTVDPDGVALAAIQGLREIVLEQREEIARLEERLAALERRE